ncbi:PqqD family protein [Gammaproteobacteria bacterium]
MLLHENVKITRNAGAISAPLEEGLALLDIERGAYFDFNAVARSIWEALDSPITPTELRDQLLATYDVPPEQCFIEVMEFLNYLQSKGLLHIVGQSR